MVLPVRGEVRSRNDAEQDDVITLENASAAMNNDVSKSEISSTAFNPKEPDRAISTLERRLLWKQDLVIVPLMALTYFTSWLVRDIPTVIYP